MVGCFAIADSSQTIRTDLDNELEGVLSAQHIYELFENTLRFVEIDHTNLDINSTAYLN